MYDTIVLPTDGTGCATHGLDHAISLAGRYDAELHVLYVVQDSKIPAMEQLSSIVEDMTTAGEEILEQAEKRARDAQLYQVTTHLRRGPAHRRILELADEQDADLIVMGTHGRSGVERYLLGSTTEKVIRGTPVPILAVEPVEQ